MKKPTVSLEKNIFNFTVQRGLEKLLVLRLECGAQFFADVLSRLIDRDVDLIAWSQITFFAWFFLRHDT